MARYPKALWKPLPQNSTQPKIVPVGIVLHTGVTDATSLWSFMNGRSAGVESHLYVREDGMSEQYMDSTVRADCQMDGNSWTKNGVRYGFISIETWDGGDPDHTPWNAQQLETIEDIIRWASRLHNFPIVVATGPQGTGVGYHAQFTDVASDPDPSWNHSHSCPTPTRIAQIPALLARAKSSPEDDLTPEQAKQLAAVAADSKRNQERYADLLATVQRVAKAERDRYVALLKTVQTWGARNRLETQELQEAIEKAEAGE